MGLSPKDPRPGYYYAPVPRGFSFRVIALWARAVDT